MAKYIGIISGKELLILAKASKIDKVITQYAVILNKIDPLKKYRIVMITTGGPISNGTSTSNNSFHILFKILV